MLTLSCCQKWLLSFWHLETDATIGYNHAHLFPAYSYPVDYNVKKCSKVHDAASSACSVIKWY